MSQALITALPTPQRLALAYAPVAQRDAAGAAFALDSRLAQFVGQATEPLVAQLRLAWWREQLAKPSDERAKGDEILDALALHWKDHGAELAVLVDGWERLLSEPPLESEAMIEFAAGRGRLFAGLALIVGLDHAVEEADRAGRLWALADLAAHSTEDGERSTAVDAGRSIAGSHLALPRGLRHLAILGGLGRSAVLAGGTPLMARRRDALRIMRLGMFGR